MPLPGDHAPVWNRARSPRRYPALEQDAAADVAVIGGGIAGLTTALLLKEAGQKVILLDRRTIGSGASGHTSGHLTAVPDVSFEELIDAAGENGARRVLETAGEAIDFIEHRAGPACGFRRVPGYLFTERLEDVPSLDREGEAATRLGMAVRPVPKTPLPFPVRGALEFDNQALFHPGIYLDALAARVDGDGSRIHEETRVERIEDGSPVRVVTPRGRVSAAKVVEATHTPLNLDLAVHTRVAPYMTYVVALRTPAPEGLFWDLDDPYHYLRPVDLGGDPHVLLGGADHKTGHEPDPESRYRHLIDYAAARFPGAAIAGHWAWEVFEPADGIPFIGRKPGTRSILVAAGFSGTGLTYGTAAGRILSDLILERENPRADLFSPSRVNPLASAREFLRENLDVAWRLVSDRLRRDEEDGAPPLAPGEGKILDLDGRKAALYRDPEGHLHALSPVCTHAGCIVHWNPVEKTWDCPCHGGRYTPSGEAISSPPTRNLRRLT